MPEHLLWPDYSAAQFRAIAEALASAIRVAEHGERRCAQAAKIDPTGTMAAERQYYRHAARYCRWLASHLERRRAQALRDARKHGTTN
jgi:hypothetical protein